MKWTGFSSLVVYWIFTLTAVFKNSSWWRLKEHAYSKLGIPHVANDHWIFWIGLLIGGALMVAFGLWMVGSDSKLKIVGGSYVTLSGIFMGLIAPIHAGLRSHDTLAFLTFMFYYAGSSLYGLGSDSIFLKVSQPSIFAAALLGMFLVDWSSLGTLETYGITLITLSTLSIALIS